MSYLRTATTRDGASLSSATSGRIQLDESQLKNTFAKLTSSSGNKTAKRLVRNKDAIHDLLNTLDRSPRFTKMIEYSVGLFKSMAVDEVCVEELIEEGVLEALMKIQKLNPYNEAVNRAINDCIAAFCLNDHCARLVAERIGGGNMIFSLKKHVEPETVSASCHAMARMMRVDTSVDMFVTEGAIDALNHVAVQMNQEPEVMASVAECLRCIARNPDYISAIMNTQLLQNLLKALQEHPDNANLVQQTLQFLAAIAKHPGAHIDLLRSLGVVDLIVAALEHQGDNKALLRLGADALKNLASDGDMHNALACKIGLTDETAHALSKLAAMMLVEENINTMIANQGLQWLIEAMQTAIAAPFSETSARIMVSGCHALNRMCVDEQKIYALMQAGGVNVLMAVVANHAHDENVLVAALQAVARTITRKENAEFILKYGVMATVATARQMHPESARVALPCADICERMARHHALHTQLVEQGIVTLVKDMLAAFMDNKEIVRACLDALAHLAETPEGAAALIAAGIAELIAKVLQKYPDDEELVKASIAVLTNLAQNSADGAEYLRSIGAAKTVLAALDKLAGNAEVQALGAALMKLLAGENQLKEAVANVWSLAQHMLKNPDQKEQYARKLADAVALLKNLCLVEANYQPLTKNNAQAALTAAIEAGLGLSASATKTSVLTDATQGLERLVAVGDAVIARQVTSSGAIFMLLREIANNTDGTSEDLAEHAMVTTALCARHPVNHTDLIAGGIVPSVVGLSKQFPYNETVQANASATLGALCMDPNAAAQMVQAGGAKTVIDALYTNIDSPAQLLSTLDIIRAIAADPAVCQALWDAGVLDAVLHVWRKQEGNADVVEACVNALVTMLVSEDIGLEMGNKGVLNLAIPAIRAHYKRGNLVENDVVMLDSMATIRPNAIKLLEDDFSTCDLMRWVQRKYKDRQETVDAAGRLIETLEALEYELEQERLELEVNRMKADDASVKTLITDMVNTGDVDALETMFQKLNMLCENADVTKSLAKNGGLEAMSKIVLAHKENEKAFKSAVNMFQKMCCDFDDEILDLLEEPSMLGAQTEIVRPHPTFQEPLSEEQVFRTVDGLGKLQFNDAAAEQVADNGGLAALSKILTTTNNKDIMREVAKVLGKASMNEHAVEVMTQGFANGLNGFASIRELIDAMRRHIDNVEFLRFGVYLLASLACTEALKDEIGIQSGVQLIIQVNQRYLDNYNLAKNCLFALAQLTYRHAINCAFVMACKGIPLTIQMMQRYMTQPDLLESAACVLGNLCFENDSNKMLIINEGGAQVIVDTVLNNFDQLDVVINALSTLSTLAHGTHAVDAILRAGGVQAVVATMTVLGDNFTVIDAAMRVLNRLASNASEEHMRIMAEEGAVQAIVEVAAAHTNVTEIALSCVTALCDLATMLSNADLIIKQGGCEVVIAALTVLGNDAEFVEMAIRLLFNLTYSVNNLNRIINAGVARAVLFALQHQLNAVQVVSIGLRTITNLCYTDEVAVTLAEDGPIEFIIQLMHNALVSPTVGADAIITESTIALSALCRPEQNALAMASAAIQLASTCLRTHGANYLLCKDVCAFLANLFVHGPAAIAAMEHTIVPDLLRLVSLHIVNPELLLVACKPLENVTYGSQGVRDRMKELLVIEKMTEVINNNADREDVRKAANAVILAVNRTEFVSDSLDFVELGRSRRNLKDVYDALGEKKEERTDMLEELPPKVKNFLTAGALLIKHSKTAMPRPRHVYVTDDLKWLVWRDPKAKTVDPEQRMKIFKIRTVERGRCTFQLQRQRFGSYLAKENCAFSIQGRERTVDLEASSEKEREKWVDAIEQLIKYKKSIQALQHKAAQFN